MPFPFSCKSSFALLLSFSLCLSSAISSRRTLSVSSYSANWASSSSFDLSVRFFSCSVLTLVSLSCCLAFRSVLRSSSFFAWFSSSVRCWGVNLACSNVALSANPITLRDCRSQPQFWYEPLPLRKLLFQRLNASLCNIELLLEITVLVPSDLLSLLSIGYRLVQALLFLIRDFITIELAALCSELIDFLVQEF